MYINDLLLVTIAFVYLINNFASGTAHDELHYDSTFTISNAY